MSDHLNPYDHPDMFVYMYLGATRSPPIMAPGGLTGHDRKQKWDVQAAKAQTGSTSQLVGDEIGKFTVTFYLCDDEDEQDLDAFRATAESTVRGPNAKALPVWHPDLADNDFTEVCLDFIGGRLRDSKGGSMIPFGFIESRPPKPKPATKPKAAPAASTTKEKAKPDPNADAKRELNRLLDEAAKP